MSLREAALAAPHLLFPPHGSPMAGRFALQESAMAIPHHASRNFQTLLQAARNDDLALMECLDAETRELRYVLCAVGRDGEDFVFTPFGHLAPGNPFEAYLPPGEGGGFVSPE
jgi:hypothetical protein